MIASTQQNIQQQLGLIILFIYFVYIFIYDNILSRKYIREWMNEMKRINESYLKGLVNLI
jgi:hypothetical protein